MNKVFFFLASITASISSQIQSQTCPNVQTVKNFQVNKYVGLWYEIKKYPFIFESLQTCVTANYTLNSDGTVTVVNTGYIPLGLFNLPLSITGLARAKDPSNLSNLTVTFNSFSFGEGNYWILDTDYVSYSLVYSCVATPVIPSRIENAWILSRKRTLDSQTIQRLTNILSEAGSSTYEFTTTIQTGCGN